MDQSRRVERKLAAILAADVVGYSRMMGLDETGTLDRLKTVRHTLINPLIDDYHGRIVKLMGDGALVEFPSIVDAVACAVEIQRGIARVTDSAPEPLRISFRIGINLGDVIIDGADVYGDGVNIAARLEGLSEPGGIVVSGTAYEHVNKKLDVVFKSLGDQHLKNIAEPVRAYSVVFDGVSHPTAIRLRNWQMLGAGVAVILVAIAGLSVWGERVVPRQTPSVHSTTPLEGKPSIAVIPFASFSDDAKQDYFADGLTNDIITDLSKVSGLVVIARNSVFAFKNQNRDARDVAAQLNVRYLLEGDVRRSGNKVRVNVQLTDASTRANLWAERYDGDYANLFDLQDRLVGKVVEALSVRLTESETIQIARLPTRNLEAYDYYTRAEQKAFIADFRSLREALALYEKAISLDPTFSDAYAGYARASVDVLGFDYQPVMLSVIARQRAYDAAGRALELNPKTSRAYSVLGILQMLDREFDRAIESVRTAEKLDPNGADAKLNLAIVLTYAGQNAEALSAMEQLFQLDPKPRPQVSAYRALVLYMNRRYEDAAEMLNALRPESLDDQGLQTLAMTNVRLGRIEEARKAAKLFLIRDPGQNISFLRVLYDHYLRQADLDDRMEALQVAGIPEWPYGFAGRPENRLDGAAIRAIALDKIWSGRQQEGAPFFMQLGSNGDFAQRAQSGMLVGRFTVEGDLFCVRSDAILLGRRFCSPVYRNVNQDQHFDYVYPDYANVWYFSVSS